MAEEVLSPFSRLRLKWITKIVRITLVLYNLNYKKEEHKVTLRFYTKLMIIT